MSAGETPRPERRRRTWTISVIIAVVGVAALAVAAGVIARTLAPRDGPAAAPPDATQSTEPRHPSSAPTDATVSASWTCPRPTTTVSTAAELTSALKAAKSSDVILIRPGRYTGRFTATAKGTADAPITLCGTSGAVLDGGGIEKGYVLHLDGAAHWVLGGFSVQNGQKGVMADRTTNSVIRNLTVSDIGDEGIHLRAESTDNQVLFNAVSGTGKHKAKFGEGIYIGTAKSNWCTTNGCKPDASDRNLIEGNHISGTTAESIDVKEGTTGGILRGNTLEGTGMTAADSWVDVKGNDWVIEGNTGSGSPKDGFQTHQVVDGWGTGNVFAGNTAHLGDQGVAFAFAPALKNVLRCDNTVTGGRISNVTCQQ
jgi:hypothetical protein